MSRPTVPEVVRALDAGGISHARVYLATLRVPGEKGARVVEGVVVEGTEDAHRVPRPVPIAGYEGEAAAKLLHRAFPACAVTETGYFTLFVHPKV